MLVVNNEIKMLNSDIHKHQLDRKFESKNVWRRKIFSGENVKRYSIFKL